MGQKIIRYVNQVKPICSNDDNDDDHDEVEIDDGDVEDDDEGLKFVNY